jgi:hypothetical protein
MNKRMIGEIVVVVIDEIGEVTFARDPMYPLMIAVGRKETLERAFTAMIELVDLCSTFVPVSAAQFALRNALELLLRDQAFLTERLMDQVEFSDGTHEAADLGGQLNTSLKRKSKQQD